MLITDKIKELAIKQPSKTSVVIGTMRLSYQELNSRINKICNSLIEYEYDGQLNDIIAILLDNSLELLEFFLAGAKVGWISAILDPKWSVKHLDECINDCKPKVVVVDEANFVRLKNIPRATQVVIVGVVSELFSGGNVVYYSSWVADAFEEEPKILASTDDLFYMGYTSGTTGRPKGFVRTHQSWIKSFEVSTKRFELHADDRIFAPGPLVHSLSIYAAAHTLYLGGIFYLLPKFDAASVLDTIESNSITCIYLVPTMFEAIYRNASEQTKPVYATSLRRIISSGDKWKPDSKQKVKSIFPNVGLYEFYGASELSFVTILDPEGNRRKPDSVGTPVNNIEIEIRDSFGQRVQTGDPGQLYVKSKMVFAGYYNNFKETEEVLQGAWASVGDIARQDKEGFIYIVGRKKNMLISGGLNIYPEEVEQTLLTLPQIEEAIVTGIPDAYWGQKVVALISVSPGNTIEDRDIKSFCREHLATYKYPREIIRMDSFPYTTSGKINRQKVNELLLERMSQK